MSFYIYATSAVKFPGNTQSEFKFHLPYPITLNGTYYCALSEIHIGNDQLPLPLEKDREITWSYGENDQELEKYAITFALPERYYKDISELVTTINSYLDEYVSEIDRFSKFGLVNFVKTMYYEQYNKLYWSCSRDLPNQHLKCSKKLSAILGFRYGEWFKIDNGLTPINVNFTPSINHMNIVTNLTHPERFGNQMLPILRQVVLKSKKVGAYISITYNPPQYKKVRLNNLDLIDIKILDEAGNPARFENFGEIICVLHFTPESEI